MVGHGFQMIQLIKGSEVVLSRLESFGFLFGQDGSLRREGSCEATTSEHGSL